VETVRAPLLVSVSLQLALYESTQMLSLPFSQVRMMRSVPLATAVKLMGAAPGLMLQTGSAGSGLGMDPVTTAA